MCFGCGELLPLESFLYMRELILSPEYPLSILFPSESFLPSTLQQEWESIVESHIRAERGGRLLNCILLFPLRDSIFLDFPFHMSFGVSLFADFSTSSWPMGRDNPWTGSSFPPLEGEQKVVGSCASIFSDATRLPMGSHWPFQFLFARVPFALSRRV